MRQASDSALWHTYWLSMVGPAQREQRRGQHRADIVAFDGCVVEVQHASMAPTQIAGRELDHGHMVWIWDAREFYRSGRLELLAFEGGVARFRWRNARRNIRSCRRPVFLDLWEVGETRERFLLLVETFDEDGHGVGRLVSHRAIRLWLTCGIPYQGVGELPRPARASEPVAVV